MVDPCRDRGLPLIDVGEGPILLLARHRLHLALAILLLARHRPISSLARLSQTTTSPSHRQP